MNKIMKSNEIQTSIFFSNGREVKVHAVQTGLISVKENFLKSKGSGIRSKLNIVLWDCLCGFYAHLGLGN